MESVNFPGVRALTGLALAATAWSFQPGAGDTEPPAAARPATVVVDVIRPRRAPPVAQRLPATLEAHRITSLYARVSGYLKSWSKDLGDPVKAGEVLARLDTPEVVWERDQARAQRDQAKAQLAEALAAREEAASDLTRAEADLVRADAERTYGEKTAERFLKLHRQGVVTRDDLELKMKDRDARRAEISVGLARIEGARRRVKTLEATIESRQASIAAIEANLHRFEELVGFATVTAPFDGVVLHRGVEVGTLVKTGADATELYRIGDPSHLRVKLDLPQALATSVTTGTRARVVSPEDPAGAVQALVTRLSGSIDPATRTRAVELDLENASGAFLAGSFARVEIEAGPAVITVPPSSIVTRAGGSFVLLVGENQRLESRPVTLGRDRGDVLEILAGLDDAVRVVATPTTRLKDGQVVSTREREQVARKP